MNTPNTNPFTAFSLSIDPLTGIDIHFSGAVLNDVLKDIAPIVMPALEKMRNDMLRQHLTPQKKPSPSKQKAATQPNRSTRTKK